MTKRADRKFHYAWVILICCCLLLCGGMGVYRYCMGLFFVPVSSDIGVSVGNMGILVTIQGLCGLAAIPLVSKLLPGKRIGKIIAAAAVLFYASVATLFFSTSYAQWIIVSGIVGFSSSFFYITPVPLLIDRWFKARKGIVLGFAMLFTSLGGTIFSPVVSALIDSFGWRNAILFQAGIGLAIILPVSLLLIRYDPSEKGCKPYGAEKEEYKAAGRTLEKNAEKNAEETAVRTPDKKTVRLSKTPAAASKAVLPLLMISLVFLDFGPAYMPFISPFGTSIGFEPWQAALLVSLASIGTIIWKLILGQTNDRFGTTKAFLFGAAAGIAGYLVYMTSVPTFAVISTGTILIGVLRALGVLNAPLMVKQVAGEELYPKILPWVSSMATVIASLGSGLVGILYDEAGSYAPGFGLGAVLLAGSVLLYLCALRFKRKTV